MITFVGFGQSRDDADAIKAWLEQAGYKTSNFIAELSWMEHTKKGNVYGFLLRNTITGGYEEVYMNEQGNQLNIEDLKEMNLSPKNWYPSEVGFQSETGTNQKKLYGEKKEKTRDMPIKKLQLKPSQYTFNLPPPLFSDKYIPNNLQEKGLLEIGKVIPIERPITLFNNTSSINFTQEVMDRYSIYSLNFFAEGVEGIKLHLLLSELLPPLHNIYIMGNDNNNELIPISGEEEDIWTPIIFSSYITLFYVKPENSLTDSIPLTIKEYAYIYKDPIHELSKLGTCYEDVMCYEPWRTLSRGVVGIVRISNPNVIFCTGSLLNDGKEEQISQLVLTASHCVDNQITANNLDFIWMYQTIDCNGTVPDITQVPRTTGGADFLVGSNTYGGTDMTLLRMKNTPPNNVVELGFTNAVVPMGVSVVTIHHPGRSYKRISFANKTNTGSPISQGRNIRPLDKYHEVIYTLSSTESGSSGGPLFLADTQQIIGQLWGGNASCSYMNEPDYFGRLDVSYPLIEPYIFIPPNVFDVDGSGTVNNEDLDFVINAVLGVNSRIKTDLNNDGKTDALDIQQIRNQIYKLN